MNKIKNVVVATDFSDIADKAFTTAVQLASQLGATLHIVHIVQIHPANMPESGNVNIKELEALEENAASENMKEYTNGLDDELKVSCHIVHGDPAGQVLKLVKDQNADLIVMGTHGRTGISRLIMGSVAESVLKSSQVPVVCVKSK